MGSRDEGPMTPWLRDIRAPIYGEEGGREGCDHGPFEEMPSISAPLQSHSSVRSRRSEVARFVGQKIQSEMAIDEKMGGMKIAPLVPPLAEAATAIAAAAAATPFTAAKNFRDDSARFFRRYDGRHRRRRQNGLA